MTEFAKSQITTPAFLCLSSASKSWLSSVNGASLISSCKYELCVLFMAKCPRSIKVIPTLYWQLFDITKEMARMTCYHKELLVNFIEMNRSMVRSKELKEVIGNRTVDDVCFDTVTVEEDVDHHSNSGRGEAGETRHLWDEVALRLSAAGAVKRSGDEWKKAWGELVCRTKKLVRTRARGGACSKQPTPLDHRIVAAGSGNLLLKETNGDALRPLSPEGGSGVKEEVAFSAAATASDRPRRATSTSDRTSEEPECEDVLLGASPPRSPPSPGQHRKRGASESVWEACPAWLRETQRARAAAARLQAEALVRLADAAHAQADAVARIARILEHKFS